MRIVIILAFLLSANSAYPCATFVLPDHRMLDLKNPQPQAVPNSILGKSYEWHTELGMVVINKRGVQKQALVLSATDKPATWQSRYASVTFNQYGREFPIGGMSERGIVVEALILPQTKYSQPDSRPVVNELNLVQYILDQAKSTEHALKLAKKVRVAPVYANLHYFVCSLGGTCGVIEFLDGNTQTTTSGFANTVLGLTNSPIQKCNNAWARRDMKNSTKQYHRFIDLYKLVLEGMQAKPENIAAAWDILGWLNTNSVSPMQWQIIYEIGKKQVHFRTRKHHAIKTIDLNTFNPECSAPVMMASMNSEASGDISNAFVYYNQKANQSLVAKTLGLLGKQFSADAINLIAKHPQKFKCISSATKAN
ncbi:MAG: hypothetical protein JW841_02930 [Deltaproteobacteria bacterium]|nr:hypothetical protein [Deltaproteobacteria bacterium]